MPAHCATQQSCALVVQCEEQKHSLDQLATRVQWICREGKGNLGSTPSHGLPEHMLACTQNIQDT
eukprot:1011532-Pelagomonas_calceolata.AAC.2